MRSHVATLALLATLYGLLIGWPRPSVDARLLKLLAREIDELAALMGFSPRLIATRDFRARREGGHIIGIFTE